MYKLIGFGFMACLAQPGLAATTLIGNAQFVGGGPVPQLLEVGRAVNGAFSGTAVIDGGSLLTLTTGPGSDEFTIRPKLDVGEEQTGNLRITGHGTKVELLGTASGSKMEVGTGIGGDGTIEITDGAAVTMTGGPVTEYLESVIVQFGETGGTGRFLVKNGALDMTGYRRVTMLAGTDGLSSGEITLDASSVTMTSKGDAENSRAGIFIGAGPWTDGKEGGSLTVKDTTLSVISEKTASLLFVGLDGGSGSALFEGTATDVTLSGATDASIHIGEGDGGSGIMTVRNGAHIRASAPQARLFVGAAGDGSGRMRVDTGAEVRLETGGDGTGVQIGESDARVGPAGFGSLSVHGPGALVATDGRIGVGADFGTQTVGVLDVSEGGRVRAARVHIGAGGSLVGSGGTVEASVDLAEGGVISPGFSPGFLTIDGDLFLRGGKLNVEIAGTNAGAFDRLDILGTLFADAAFDIEFHFLGGFLPEPGTAFGFLSASAFSGDLAALANVSVFGAASDVRALLVPDKDGLLSVSFVKVASVPLPAAFGPLVLALGILGAFGGWQTGGRRAV